MDNSNSADYFNPPNIHPVCIVGVGALGSHCAMQLARLGVRKFHLIDPDIIESHNVGNQAYIDSDISRYKVDACRNMLWDLNVPESGITINIGKVTETLYYPHVFMCVDSMTDRKTIFEQFIYGNGNTHILIEGRMGMNVGGIYGIDPQNIRHVRQYRELWYPDSEVQRDVGSCGRSINLGPMANIISGHMVMLYMAMWRRYILPVKQQEACANEIIIDAKHNTMSSCIFK